MENMTKTTVYLYRHGETVGAHEKRYKGQMEVPLSKKGELEFEKNGLFLKEKLAETPLSKIYCSDLGRAVKSAEFLGAPFNLMPEVTSGFRERHFGSWEGMSFDEIRAESPEHFDAWAKDPEKFSPPGGESTIDASRRVMPRFYRLVKEHLNEHIAIVAHGGVNRVILCELVGIPLKNIFHIEQDFACLNKIVFYDDFPVLKNMNYTLYI